MAFIFFVSANLKKLTRVVSPSLAAASGSTATAKDASQSADIDVVLTASGCGLEPAEI